MKKLLSIAVSLSMAFAFGSLGYIVSCLWLARFTGENDWELLISFNHFHEGWVELIWGTLSLVTLLTIWSKNIQHIRGKLLKRWKR